jgi:DNA-binding NarL/FixJ family response regulator
VVTVLVVDDHPLVRSGLIALLATTPDLVVVGEAADGDHAVECARRERPDVVLMDISMPGCDGVAATKRLVADEPGVRVVALTSFSDRARVAGMLSAGAVGYLLKDSEPDQLLAAVRAAAAGQVPLDPRVAGAVLPSRDGPARGLSNRERDVLRLAAKGLANKQIARELGIAERTVKVHLGHVFKHIGVGDRTSAALWAREHLALD